MGSLQRPCMLSVPCLLATLSILIGPPTRHSHIHTHQEVRTLQSHLAQRDDELRIKSKGLDLLERQIDGLQQQVWGMNACPSQRPDGGGSSPHNP